MDVLMRLHREKKKEKWILAIFVHILLGILYFCLYYFLNAITYPKYLKFYALKQ